MTAFTVPAGPPDASRSWRKTVTGVDLDRRGGYAVDGMWLDERARYDAGPQVLILGVDLDTEEGNVVTLWRVDDGGLAEVKRIVRKGSWSGKATLKAIANLAKDARRDRPVLLARASNAAAGDCHRCHRTVQPGEGVQWRRSGWVCVAHDPVCPPWPNEHAGVCCHCGSWVEAGTGHLAGYHPVRYRWLIRHAGPCPPVEQRLPLPEMTNRWEGRCRRCRRPVDAGAGVWVRTTSLDLLADGPVHVRAGYVRHLGCGGRRRRPPRGPVLSRRRALRPPTPGQATRPPRTSVRRSPGRVGTSPQ